MTRSLALFLSIILTLASPAGVYPDLSQGALRQAGLEENAAKQELLNQLDANAGVVTAHTGMEEGQEMKPHLTHTRLTTGSGRLYWLNRMLADKYSDKNIVEIGPGWLKDQANNPTNELIGLLKPGARVTAIDNFIPQVVIELAVFNNLFGQAILFNREGKIATVGQYPQADIDFTAAEKQKALKLKEELTAKAYEYFEAKHRKWLYRVLNKLLRIEVRPLTSFVDQEGNRIDFVPLVRNRFPLIWGDLNNLGTSLEAMETIRQADVVRIASILVPHFSPDQRRAVISKLGKIMKLDSRLIIVVTNPVLIAGVEAIEYVKKEDGMVPQNFMIDVALTRAIPRLGTGFNFSMSDSGGGSRELDDLLWDFLRSHGDLWRRVVSHAQSQGILSSAQVRTLEYQVAAGLADDLKTKGDYSVSFESGMIIIPIREVMKSPLAARILEGLLPTSTTAGLEESGIESLTNNLVWAWNQLLGAPSIEHLTVADLRRLKEKYDRASRDERISIEETLWAASRKTVGKLSQKRLASPAPIRLGGKPRIFVPMFIGFLDLFFPFKKEGETLVVDPTGLSVAPASAQANVLRALTLMGAPVKTAGTFGKGIRGSLYMDLLEREGVTIDEGDWMKISGQDTGLNFFTIFRQEGFNIEDRFISPAPVWTAAEKEEYLRRVEKATKEMDKGIFVLSMRPPFNIPELMAQLLQIAKRNKMFTIYDPKLDVVGNPDLIKSIFREGLDLFKPNLQELAILLSMDEAILRGDPKLIVGESRKLMATYGIRMMLVSLDKDGALLIDHNRTAFARPPRIQVVSSVGAGDTALAALIDRYTRMGFSFDNLTDDQFRELVHVFVAAGTETSRQPGTGLATPEGIRVMEQRVQSFVYSNDRLNELIRVWPAAGLEEVSPALVELRYLFTRIRTRVQDEGRPLPVVIEEALKEYQESGDRAIVQGPGFTPERILYLIFGEPGLDLSNPGLQENYLLHPFAGENLRILQYVVESAVEMMKRTGSKTLSSAGVVFHLELPGSKSEILTDRERTALAGRVLEVAGLSAAGLEEGIRRLLIVEDMPEISDAEMAIARGFLPNAIIETADDFNVAKRLIEMKGREYYDAYVIDQILPGGEGLTLIKDVINPTGEKPMPTVLFSSLSGTYPWQNRVMELQEEGRITDFANKTWPENPNFRPRLEILLRSLQEAVIQRQTSAGLEELGTPKGIGVEEAA